jgi:hypothetical protein
LVAFRRKRNLYALRAFLLLFAIEKEAEFEAEPHKLLINLLKLTTLGDRKARSTPQSRNSCKIINLYL